MIVETIVATLDAKGKPNFAPMGVRFVGNEIVIRPFKNTKTYHNLVARGQGVVNIVDDVLLIVETALYSAVPPHFRLADGLPVLDDACSYCRFRVGECIDTSEPARLTGKVVEQGSKKEFQGFCRASFAVLEMAILATRLHLTGKDTVLRRVDDWSALVKKTGGQREIEALNILVDYIRSYRAV